MNREPEQPVSKSLPSWLVPVMGYLLSAASLYWVFRGFDLKQAVEDFLSLDWRFVTLAVVSDLAIYFCGGWRWTVLLRAVGESHFWRSVQSIYIGLYANEILPLRPGEVIRCYLMHKWSDIPMSITLSAAAIERVQEGLWLVLGFLITTFYVDLPTAVEAGAQILAAVVLVLAGVLIFVATRKQDAHAVVANRKWHIVVSHIIDGIHAMGNRRPLLITFFASFLYLVLQIIPVWALMQGYGLDLSIWAASAVLIILRLGTIVPNAPGNLGLYQAMCVVGLRLFGVDKTTAVGFSLMMFGVLTLPLLIGGAIAVALSGLKLGDIHHHARRSVSQQPAGSPQASKV
jgi:glycosyltransferase 2 family protein